MADTVFVKGIFVKTVETQYGELIKLDVELEGFTDFLVNEAKDFIKIGNNGKKYLSLDIKKGRDSGKYYLSVDTWRPKADDCHF